MNLNDLLSNYQPHAPICRFAPWLAALPTDDQNAVHRAFDNPEIPTRHIYTVLRDQGLPIRESALRAHRRGECQYCERQAQQ